MEEHRDEQLNCADCGAPFVFGADEAAVFAQRGLAPPKRCKECRRARKERPAAQGHFGGHPETPGGRPAGGPHGAPRHAGPRRAVPRYTGDVNEYRSPMQDSFAAPPYGAFTGSFANGNAPPRARHGGARRASYADEYRSPMQDKSFSHAAREDGNVRQDTRTRGPGGGRPEGRRDGRREGAGGAPKPRPLPRQAEATEAHAAPEGEAVPRAPGEGTTKSRRRRGPTAKFAITCTSCGAHAEVPFEPAEGRDVFCPTCYRARRSTMGAPPPNPRREF